MKHASRKVVFAALVLVSSCVSYAQAIPDIFDTVQTSEPQAYEFARQCVPSFDEATFKNMVSQSNPRTNTAIRPPDKSQSYLILSFGQITCVRMSERKYPLIALEAFVQTIEFPQMNKDDLLRLRLDLARQLATSGFATALVIHESGNASQLVYMLNAERPTKFSYHLNFARKGEFAEIAYPRVYRTAGDGSVVARGMPFEQVKHFAVR